jgi:hypothetical protein
VGFMEINQIEPWDDDYGDESDSEDIVPSTKKQEIKNLPLIPSGFKYANKELIDKTDALAQEILSSKKHMYIREKFFGAMIDRLGLKTGVEIGVDVGEFSQKLLSICSLEKLYGVDFWPNDFGSDFREGFFDKTGENRYLKCQETLKDYIDKRRCKLIKATSIEAAKNFEDNSLDFVYIDGDHSLEMLFDLYAWIPKLKIGGIFSGHDWKDGKNSGIRDAWGNQLDYAVKQCTEYFAKRYGYKLNSVGGIVKSWWFIKNR